MSVPEIVETFKHRGVTERQIYRLLKKYGLDTPAKRRKKFFEDTVNATKLSQGVSPSQKKKNCKEAIKLLAKDLVDSIEKKAVAFEEKWN